MELTARQRKILELAAYKSNRQIAHELGISHHTVKSQLRIVYLKLGIERRTGLHKRIPALWEAGIFEAQKSD